MSSSVLDDLRNPGLRSLLDLLRWVAAVTVVFGHLRENLLVRYGDVSPDVGAWARPVFYGMLGFQWEALEMIFVLSGFLVGGMGLARCRAGKFAFGSFAVARVSRLYIVLLPALALGWVLDSWGASYFAELGLYDSTRPAIAGRPSQYPFGSHLSGNVLFGNLLMLQYFAVRPLGSNIPLWALSVEFWSYVVFACAAVAFWGRSWWGRGLGLIVLLLVLVGFHPSLTKYLVMWLFGLCAALPGGRVFRRPLLSGIAALGAVITARMIGTGGSLSMTEFMIGRYLPPAAFAWFIFSMRGQDLPRLARMLRFNEHMASFAFSLFLVHYPLMLVGIGLSWKHFGLTRLQHGYQPGDFEGVLLLIVLFAVIMLLAYGFAWMTERRLGTVRRLLRIGSRRPG